MRQMPFSVNGRHPATRLCTDALLLCAALMLSYVEALLPVSALLPLPGFRLGLAQLLVTFAYFHVGRADAAAISALRVLIMSVLFGSVTSLYFSALGALLALGGLWLGEHLMHRFCSYIGLGALCAVLHNLGQALAAATLFGAPLLLSYLPVLLMGGTLLGGVGGAILNRIVSRWPRRIRKDVHHEKDR